MTEYPRAVDQQKVTVAGTAGVVTSSQASISLAGALVLADGGNAFDAMLAMIAASWIALPGQCGIGGDAFALVRDRDGGTWTLNGSGFGPDGGTPAFYKSRGLASIPLGGALSVAVPGAIAVVRELQHRASRPLSELWAPAIASARRGVVATEKNVRDITEHAASLAVDEGARVALLPLDRVPAVGELLHMIELAATLECLAEDLDDFYLGSFADRAVDALQRAGAPFTGDEWRLGGDVVPTPALSGTYADARLHVTPLPSAGWMILHQAALLDGLLEGVGQLSAEAVHLFAEAARSSFRHRFDAVNADSDAWRAALMPQAIDRQREQLAHRRASGARGISDGDTTSMVCVDAEGVAVSFIHSLAFTYGARITVPGTGVLLNNRLGRGAYLIDGHPNEVCPRRKPMHTLNAWLMDTPNGIAVGNCPGGDGQVQWNMQVISHLVDHGNDPQRAVAMPRVTVFPGSDADTIEKPSVLRCESGIDPAALSQLEKWGHVVERQPVQRHGPGGSALVITADRISGVTTGAADPRMEGIALAL